MKPFHLLILLPLICIGLFSCNTTSTEEPEGNTTSLSESGGTAKEEGEDSGTGDWTSQEAGTSTPEGYDETNPVDYTYVIEEDYENLKEALAYHFKEAETKGQTPFVYFTASWCPPCQAIKEYQNDPAMMDAYNGTYIVELDYDEIPDDISEEFTDGAIPAWSGFNEDGSTNDLWVDGGAWGANIPANMAPVLKHYFNYTGDPLDYDPI